MLIAFFLYVKLLFLWIVANCSPQVHDLRKLFLKNATGNMRVLLLQA